MNEWMNDWFFYGIASIKNISKYGDVLGVIGNNLNDQKCNRGPFACKMQTT